MAKTSGTAPAVALTGAQVRKLRALGHALDPVVSIGKQGITDALVAAAASALGTHELVKVKVQGEAPLDRREAAEQLAQATGAVLAQVLGRTFLLYKRHPKKPKIDLSVRRGDVRRSARGAEPDAGKAESASRRR